MITSGNRSNEPAKPTGLRSRLAAATEIVAIYGTVAIFAILGMGVVLVWRTVLMQAYMKAVLRPLSMPAFLDTFVVIACVTWLALVIVVEEWLRRGAVTGRLYRRIAIALGIEVVVFAVGYLIPRL